MTDIPARLAAALADRYRIERRLGEGGMATVYLADDLKHERKVAIKVLKQELAAVIGAERFLAEIRTTANLQHPHILPLFDSGEADHFLFYVMPYVEGESLRTLLDREKQLSVNDAIRITKQVGSAIDYAHRQSVIHRDIKPENVLMHDGQPLVADFGIALAVTAAGAGRLTETGLSLGTPYYMSPEQATADRDPGPQSDVYSLACMLYEMLVGDPPHTGSSAQAVLAKILTERPRPVTQLRETVPLHVGAAVAKALERLPADRFGTAAAFVEALDDPGFTHETVAQTWAVPAQAAPARRSKRWLSALPWAIAAAALVPTLWTALQPVPPPRVTRVVVSLDEDPTSEDPGSISYNGGVTISPDGSEVVYVRETGGVDELWRRGLDELATSPIPGGAGGYFPAFSHDGEWLAFVTSGALHVVPAQGGSRLSVSPGTRFFAWGDDGSIYGFPDGDLARWVPGAGVWEILLPDAPFRISDVLPGSNGILGRSRDGMVAVDLRSFEVQGLGEGDGATYLGTGHIAFSRLDGVLMVQPFDLGTLRTTGAAIAAPDGDATGSSTDFRVSADGSLIYISQPVQADQEYLAWINRSGGVEPLGWLPPTGYSGIALSPSGTMVAAGVGEANTFSARGRTDVWRFDLDARTSLRLTDNESSFRPKWHPDGDRLVYIDASGSGLARVIPIDRSSAGDDLVDIELPADAIWLPGGEELVIRMAGRQRSLFRFVPDEHEAPVPFVDEPYDEVSPSPSPDGQWMVYVSDQSGRQEVVARPWPDGGGLVPISTAGGSQPAWSRDGRELFYVDAERTMWSLTVEYDDDSFRVTDREPLFTVDARLDGARTVYEVAPDGRFLFVMGSRNISGDGSRVVLVRNWVQDVTAGR
jgi:serine/threonine-protein kinase